MTIRPIRLFVDARWAAQPGQGTATYLAELYSRLPTLTHGRVELIYGMAKGQRPAFAPTHAELLEYPDDGFAWRTFGLGARLNALRLDAVHFQYVLPWGLSRNIRTIVATHDLIFMDHPTLFPWHYRATRRYFFRESAERADAVLTLSEQSAASIRRHCRVAPERLHIMPLGVGSRLTALVPQPVSGVAAGRYLLAVGRHEARKNYARLIEAYIASELHERHKLSLWIVGQPTEGFAQHERQAPGVGYLPQCSDAELAWLYRHAYAFVFPSIAEGYGLPAVEALEFGIPVLVAKTYPVDAVRERACAVFDPYSVEAITAALRHLVPPPPPPPTDPVLPNWDTYARRFLDLLRAITNRS